MSYLLDTNICSAYLKDERRLFTRFQQYSGRLFVSRIVLAELYAWAFGNANTPEILRLIETMYENIGNVQVLEFDDRCAKQFGQLRAALKPAGLNVDNVDLMIAATALANGLTLVTHNLRHFQSIPGLTTADWLSS